MIDNGMMKMSHIFTFNGQKIEYELTYKRVKNVNIRFKNDGKIYVSAPNDIKLAFVEKVIKKNFDKLIKLQNKYSKKDDVLFLYGKEYYREDLALNGVTNFKDYIKAEALKTLPKIFDSVFNKFAGFNLKKPQLSFKFMTTRWGSCNFVKGKINLNICLVCAPIEAIEAVVAHEIAHLIYGNHSKQFYGVLLSVMPDYYKKHKLLSVKNYII